MMNTQRAFTEWSADELREQLQREIAEATSGRGGGLNIQGIQIELSNRHAALFPGSLSGHSPPPSRQVADCKGSKMDDARKQKITDLARAAHVAKQRLEMLGMQNTSGLTAEEREEQSIGYALARAEAEDARLLLELAISGG